MCSHLADMRHTPSSAARRIITRRRGSRLLRGACPTWPPAPTPAEQSTPQVKLARFDGTAWAVVDLPADSNGFVVIPDPMLAPDGRRGRRPAVVRPRGATLGVPDRRAGFEPVVVARGARRHDVRPDRVEHRLEPWLAAPRATSEPAMGRLPAAGNEVGGGEKTRTRRRNGFSRHRQGCSCSPVAPRVVPGRARCPSDRASPRHRPPKQRRPSPRRPAPSCPDQGHRDVRCDLVLRQDRRRQPRDGRAFPVPVRHERCAPERHDGRGLHDHRVTGDVIRDAVDGDDQPRQCRGNLAWAGAWRGCRVARRRRNAPDELRRRHVRRRGRVRRAHVPRVHGGGDASADITGWIEATKP